MRAFRGRKSRFRVARCAAIRSLPFPERLSSHRSPSKLRFCPLSSGGSSPPRSTPSPGRTGRRRRAASSSARLASAAARCSARRRACSSRLPQQAAFVVRSLAAGTLGGFGGLPRAPFSLDALACLGTAALLLLDLEAHRFGKCGARFRTRAIERGLTPQALLFEHVCL
jgi:hypothetical protein